MKKVTMYKELADLVEIFSNAYGSDGEEIKCFEIIKKIVDGEISKEELSEENKISAQKQFLYAEEFLKCVFMNMPMVIENRDELWEYIK